MNYYKNVDDLFLSGEIFKDIEGYNGDYQVSNFGRIKSFKRCRGKDIIILTQAEDSYGYLQVELGKNGKGKTEKVHKLLFETFNNYKIKKGECVHHLDKNILNNDLDNFLLMTNSEHGKLHNSGKNHPRFGKKYPEHSKRMSGENNPNSILTEQDVLAMKSFWDNNIKISNKLLAKWYGVHLPIISKVKNRRRWKNI